MGTQTTTAHIETYNFRPALWCVLISLVWRSAQVFWPSCLNLSSRSNSHAATFILEIVGPGPRPLFFALSIGIGIFHRPRNYATIVSTQEYSVIGSQWELWCFFAENTGKSLSAKSLKSQLF